MNSIISTGFEHIKKDYVKKKAELELKNQTTISIKSQDETFNVIINKPKGKELIKTKFRNKDANYRIKQTESEEEEENQINLSKQRMLIKAKVYEKLASTIPSDEINSMYSVDFQKKYLFERDDASQISETPMKQYTDDELKISEAVHFQEIFGDEARELGVGYYKFSTDEAERQAQLAEFKRMGEERERMRANNPELQVKIRQKYRAKIMRKISRKNWIKLTEGQIEDLVDEMIQKEEDNRIAKQKQLEAEIAAFEEYKRQNPRTWDIYKLEKAGILPSNSSNSDSRDALPHVPDIQEALVKNIPRDILRGSSHFSSKSTSYRSATRSKSRDRRSRSRTPVRIRDLRDIPRRPTQQIINQEKWVDKQREERNPDFAPPSQFYSSDYKNHRFSSSGPTHKQSLHLKTKNIASESSDISNLQNNNFIPNDINQISDKHSASKEDKYIHDILEDPLLAPFK